MSTEPSPTQQDSSNSIETDSTQVEENIATESTPPDSTKSKVNISSSSEAVQTPTPASDQTNPPKTNNSDGHISTDDEGEFFEAVSLGSNKSRPVSPKITEAFNSTDAGRIIEENSVNDDKNAPKESTEASVSVVPTSATETLTKDEEDTTNDGDGNSGKTEIKQNTLKSDDKISDNQKAAEKTEAPVQDSATSSNEIQSNDSAVSSPTVTSEISSLPAAQSPSPISATNPESNLPLPIQTSPLPQSSDTTASDDNQKQSSPSQVLQSQPSGIDDTRTTTMSARRFRFPSLFSRSTVKETSTPSQQNTPISPSQKLASTDNPFVPVSIDTNVNPGTPTSVSSPTIFRTVRQNSQASIVSETSEASVESEGAISFRAVRKDSTVSVASTVTDGGTGNAAVYNGFIKNSLEKLWKYSTVEKKDENADSVDWDFWGRVVQDYETVARKQPKTLAKKIQAEAIPPVVRGNVWQLMAKSKNIELEKNYVKLLESSSPFEKMIHRDLSRTFPNHEFFRKDGPGQESLFNVVKAYSIYDPDVGYCQGMGFVAGPLLLNMPEEEAFSLLVKLMKSYGLRGHYTPLMEGLSLRLYQFDKIVQELIPAVHEHLHQEGVRSTMYASQWFMTLFAYRFPLELVLRVFDIIIAEGVDALLRFAVAILKKNQETINKLDFEPLLEYLKTGLFEYYIANQNQFVQDALDIKITKKQLANLTKQYEDELKANDPNTLMLESLKSQNKQLEEKVRTLETNLTTLNLEHVDLANQFIQTKIDQTKLKEQNDVLSRQVLELTKSLAEEQGNVEKAASQAKEEVDAEKEKLVERNAQLEEQLKEMEQTLIMTKLQFAESENARDTLARKLMDLKKALE